MFIIINLVRVGNIYCKKSNVRGCKIFLHHFYSLPHHDKYKLIDIDGNLDVYTDSKTEMCFYHVTCHRYFTCTTHNFLTEPKLYTVPTYCPLCNRDYQLSKARLHITHDYVISHKNNKVTIKKIASCQRKNGLKRFLKRFYSLSNSNDYSLKAPDGKHEKYNGWHGEFWFYHKVCGKYSHMSVSNFFRKIEHGRYGCSYCSKKVAYKENIQRGIKKHIRNGCKYNVTFLKRVYSQSDNKTNHIYVPLQPYRGMRTKILWLVWTKHPHTMWMTPNEFLNSGKRDPSEHRYMGENCVMNYLNYYGFRRNLDYFHGYVFHSNKKKTKCLHCDVFIPGLSVGNKYNSVGIEYDGSQHFRPIDFRESFQKLLNHHKFFEAGEVYARTYNAYVHIKKRDKKKDKYCGYHHIYLIRIEHYRRNNQNYRYVKTLVDEALNKKLLPILFKK